MPHLDLKVLHFHFNNNCILVSFRENGFLDDFAFMQCVIYMNIEERLRTMKHPEKRYPNIIASKDEQK